MEEDIGSLDLKTRKGVKGKIKILSVNTILFTYRRCSIWPPPTSIHFLYCLFMSCWTLGNIPGISQMTPAATYIRTRRLLEWHLWQQMNWMWRPNSLPSTPLVPWLSYSPLDPRFVGSNPAGVDGFFQNVKILSMASFGREVKPLVPCRRFMAHKRISSRN